MPSASIILQLAPADGLPGPQGPAGPPGDDGLNGFAQIIDSNGNVSYKRDPSTAELNTTKAYLANIKSAKADAAEALESASAAMQYIDDVVGDDDDDPGNALNARINAILDKNKFLRMSDDDVPCITDGRVGALESCIGIDAYKLSGRLAGYTNGRIAVFAEFPTFNQLWTLGYNTEELKTDTEAYLKGLCKWAIANFTGNESVILLGSARPNSHGFCHIELYGTNGKDADTGLPMYCSGRYYELQGKTAVFGTYDFVWYYNFTARGAATRLETSRKIWGQSFNGSADVTGSLTGVANITASGSISAAGAIKQAGVQVALDGHDHPQYALASHVHDPRHFITLGDELVTTNVTVQTMSAEITDGEVVYQRYPPLTGLTHNRLLLHQDGKYYISWKGMERYGVQVGTHLEPFPDAIYASLGGISRWNGENFEPLAASTSHSHSDHLPAIAYDFTAGFLVKTDISESVASAVLAKISGNPYSASILPIDTTIQFTHLSILSSISYATGFNAGSPLGDVQAFILDGVICLWFKQPKRYVGFSVFVSDLRSSVRRNRVAAILDAALPTDGVSRQTTITPIDRT